MIRSLSAVEGGVPMGLWISVPAYTGEIKVETAHSLNVEMLAAFNRKVPYLLYFHEQDGIITRCRNAMVMQFLASDPKHFTDMVFCDSDMGFPEGAILRLADYPVDIVGASYPYRKDPIGFPAVFRRDEKGEPITEQEAGLIRMAGMPTGFLKIGRRVFERIMERFPEHYYNDENVPQKKCWQFFEFIVQDHKFFGEDYAFCALAREAGFDIWCDPHIVMKHIGMKKFTGSLQGFIEWQAARDNPDKMALIHHFNKTHAVKVAA